ncbi:SDR family oxidoreductase [Marimonas sp. MJW-29]|uniref:SDR family oxidoreductase n=1 Tax=Sulfitobacter sediminis TaxID=3234186 RepID=A0ABV3RMD0_9RHOB
MDRTLFIFGYGYSARALARRLVPQGWRVIGTTRSVEKLTEIAETGVTPLQWPGNNVVRLLQEASHLLITAGPGPEGDPVLDALAEGIRAVAPRLRWAGYLSTTGVYGDHDGGWVDENTPLAPSTKRGKARADAEAAWRAIPDLPLHIFRLAGIYGPGRGPFSKVREGTARRIIKEGQYFSRIHVHDIASALDLSMQAPDPGAVYNLCDDDPAPPQDVIAHAAELLGLPLPPAVDFEDADMSPMARSFYAESKRVRNDRAKRALGWEPAYPDYRSGLAALLEREGSD